MFLQGMTMKEQTTAVYNETIAKEIGSEIKTGSRDPYLAIFIGLDSGKRHKLKKGKMTIGRSAIADITIDDDHISRIHCELEWIDNVFKVSDRGSTNGTIIDSRRLNYAYLPTGVPLQIGDTVMKIEYKSKAEVRSEKKLLKRACIDPLTGIFNRQHFSKIAKKEIAYARRNELIVGMIMIDIDHFKHINDTYGHLIGDFVLTQIATLIRENKRTEDILGRYGGEEFVILPRGNVKKEDMFVQCERIRMAVERFDFCYLDRNVHVTTSLGFHLEQIMDHKIDAALDNLIDRADRTLYRAKKKGRNRTMSLL